MCYIGSTDPFVVFTSSNRSRPLISNESMHTRRHLRPRRRPIGLYRTNPDFVFTVTRDFVRNCRTVESGPSQLKRVDPAGGTPSVICGVTSGREPAASSVLRANRL